MQKTILITGGSGGIGSATALEVAREGYTVCLSYRSNWQAAQHVVTHIQQNGGKAYAFQADVSQEKEVLTLFEQVDRTGGRLYGLVNNAAVLYEQTTLADMTACRIEKTFQTNVLGPFLCAKQAIARMTKQTDTQGGVIINISSGAAKSGSPNEYLDYAASKGALDTFTVGLAKEVAPLGIRVNAIRPGFIDTQLHTIPGRLEQVKAWIPLGRVGQPEEIAHAVVWLLSEKASYVTGAILDVAGGR